ncbi:probable LRR receptor-like serine/threonine-protein kinase At4g36180 [Salvia splendens]|uniref:probable LRR receptor-like serine/threonine-protein kinase At4g36180 n=1 Tax=Salvia splendens TaxID=180675 RepID=UPI001C274CDF|nr:probable LRR receptor-like serine/threonine-protein kinase At4g36180 [Salvia splendens]
MPTPTRSLLAVALCAFLTATLTCAGLVSEIEALLSFKSNLHDPRGALANWNASTPSAPCDWRGIRCSSATVVIELRLPRLHLSGTLTPRLSNLAHLQTLSLHSNNLNGSIPPTLSHCSLLRALYLQQNSLSGDFPPDFFTNLTHLGVLNLSQNLFSGQISDHIAASIRVLDLSSNSFSGPIPSNFSAAHHLQLIDLSHNRFSGEIAPAIGALQSLQYLWIDANYVYGTIPSAISNCSSLIHISAGDNMISGVVPATIGALQNLQVISLPRNHLTGVISQSLLCNISVSNAAIRIVDLSFNSLTGIGINDGKNCHSVLQVLDLNENQIAGTFPDLLMSFSMLRSLDVSGNLISGLLPENFGDLVNLEEFRVGNNSLTGGIPESVAKCGVLRVLDLGKNRFSGSIPEFLGEMRSLTTLILGGNAFTGAVPSSIGSLESLQVLDLSDNVLSGTVPAELMSLANLTILNLSFNRFSSQVFMNIGELKGLEVLNMSGCELSGVIPSSIGNLLKLKSLDLSKQNLSGELPFELFGSPRLQVVALEENSFSGNVPEGFSSLSGLQKLNLSENAFSAEIPASYGFLRSLNALSLSGNRVSGVIPVELSNCTGLEVLELRGNGLTGQIPADFSRLSHLKRLDLGRNNLTGTIPASISNCSSLEVLLLDSNQVSGGLPEALSKLPILKELDVSSNNLTGVVPASLSTISALQRLNLSANGFEGEIPPALAARFSDPSVFAMNKDLCGEPLGRKCEREIERKRKKLILFIVVVSVGSLMLLLCCCAYVYSLLRWRKKLRAGAEGVKKRSPSPGSQARGSEENGQPKLIMFNNMITYAETVEATRQYDEENVLSRGKYGLLFKATYADGMVLAIRRLADTSIDESTFRKEAESLGKVKHRNLTVLRGYYAGPPPDMRFLVYDYMPNGNLTTLLQEASHQEGHVLNWPMRHLIALGIARGLAFLHSVSIIHGDVKPQNVLFDADFEAHLSDFGLDKVTIATTSAEASTSASPVGTLGYVAPEATLTGKPSKEADVYSFGIVVLEILTGKKPVMFTEDEDIVKWVKRQLQRGQVSELLEPGLVELDPESSEWEEFLLGVKVGLLCTMPDPLERPSMNDVVFMLEGCRLGPEIPSSADPTTMPSPS